VHELLEVTIMSEARMFAIAFSSTIAMALVVAGVLFLMVAGAITYILICVCCLPNVRRPILDSIVEDEQNV
jgi:hypothetical protein